MNEGFAVKHAGVNDMAVQDESLRNESFMTNAGQVILSTRFWTYGQPTSCKHPARDEAEAAEPGYLYAVVSRRLRLANGLC